MNYQDKTKEQLIVELQELQHENISLKAVYENEIGNCKQNEMKLQISEARFRSYFELPLIGIAITSPEKGWIEANEGIRNMLGYSLDELSGLTWAELTHPDDLATDLEQFNLVMSQQKDTYFLEKRFIRKNGDIIWTNLSVGCVRKPDRSVDYMVALLQDISKRKQAEETIRKSEEKFRSLYANMIDGSALHNLVYNDQGVPEDYRIIDVNPAFESLLGISREAIINKTSKEAYGVDEPPYFDLYSKVALTGNPEVFETYFAPLDKYFSISVYCPFKGGFATIFENITERKKVENENERIQKLLEDSQRIGKIGGWEINLDTKELNWTKEMYHINEVDLTFKPEVDQRVKFYTPESLPEVDKAIQHVIEYGGSYEIDAEIITAKGNRRSVKTIGEADLENRRVFGLFQDITERKQAEAELKIKNEQLRELNATKDKFFSIIAHDLKTPFSGILGFSEILKDEARNLDINSIEDYADLLNSTAKQTYKLLENLLDWARMQQGGFHFEPKAISLNYLLKTELESLKNSADRKNITLVNKTAKEIIFIADEKMLGTVLRNLISNAIKFTPKGGKVNIEARRKVDHIEVSISDTGVGMEKEIIEKLFKIETSFTSRGTENEKGTGLGLLLCKEFVEKHSGTIWVDSEKGKGSIFTFSIPLKTKIS